MKKRSRQIAFSLAVFCYVFLCVRGWLGVSYETLTCPDGVHSASVFSHSPLLFPFWHIYEVQVPSGRDLNSHVVYLDAWFYREFDIEWQGSKKLLILFHGHSEPQVLLRYVDDVEIEEIS